MPSQSFVGFKIKTHPSKNRLFSNITKLRLIVAEEGIGDHIINEDSPNFKYKASLANPALENKTLLFHLQSGVKGIGDVYSYKNIDTPSGYHIISNNITVKIRIIYTSF